MNIKKDSSLILPWLPENLENLDKRETEIRTNSILFINGQENLKGYLDLIHTSVNTLIEFNHHYEHKSEDELTIQFLGNRLLNSIFSSLKLLLSGYYQSSVAIIRDILETGFLIDFLTFYPEEIRLWRESTHEIRRKKYNAARIRRALDKRDNFISKKREKKYKTLCEYGAHPTYSGFMLIAKEELGKIGPFYEEKYLCVLLKELIQIVPLFILNYVDFFKSDKLTHFEIILKFLENLDKWNQKYKILGIDQSSRKNLKEFKEKFQELVKVSNTITF